MKPALRLRIASGVTLFFFAFTNLAPSGFGGMGFSSVEKIPAPYLEVLLPPELGRVEETHLGSEASPVIFHLQSAHGDVGIQRQIKEILRYLRTTQGVRLVFAEGASEKLEPELLRFFKDPSFNDQMAGLLLEKGLYTGVDLFFLDPASKGAEGRGIEESRLYRAAYRAFKKVLQAEPLIDDFLRQEEILLARKAQSILSKELIELIRHRERFQDHQISFLAYVNFLIQRAKRDLGMDFKIPFLQLDWPGLVRLTLVREFERGLNREELEREKGKIITSFRENMPILGGSRNGSVRASFERFLQAIYPLGFRFEDYPQFSRWAGLQILQQELDARALSCEAEKLRKMMESSLARTEGERQILKQYDKLLLLKKLLRLELTREEWNSFRKNERRDRSGTRPYGNFFHEALRFYRLVERRDQIFFETLRREMTARGEKKALLVTGGFHTEGLSRLLRQGGFSYAVLSPRIAEEVSTDVYRKVMLDLAQIEITEAAQRAEVRAAQGRDLKAEEGLFQGIFKGVAMKNGIEDWRSAWRETPYQQDLHSISKGLRLPLEDRARAEGHAARSESRTPQSLSGQTRAEVRVGGRQWKYPDADSVRRALRARKRKRWSNIPSELSHGTHPDATLYWAARQFGIKLPQKTIRPSPVELQARRDAFLQVLNQSQTRLGIKEIAQALQRQYPQYQNVPLRKVRRWLESDIVLDPRLKGHPKRKRKGEGLAAFLERPHKEEIRGLSKKSLAKKLGIGVATLYHYENSYPHIASQYGMEKGKQPPYHRKPKPAYFTPEFAQLLFSAPFTGLSEPEIKVLEERWLYPKKLKEIAQERETGSTRQRVEQIEKVALKKAEEYYRYRFLRPLRYRKLNKEPIQRLGFFSVRVRRTFRRLKIRTVGGLLRKSPEDLLAQPNFSEASLHEIQRILASYGLRLRQAAPPRAEVRADLVVGSFKKELEEKFKQMRLDRPGLELELTAVSHTGRLRNPSTVYLSFNGKEKDDSLIRSLIYELGEELVGSYRRYFVTPLKVLPLNRIEGVQDPANLYTFELQKKIRSLRRKGRRPEPLPPGEADPAGLRKLIDTALQNIAQGIRKVLQASREDRGKISPEVAETLRKESESIRSLIGILQRVAQHNPEQYSNLLRGLDYTLPRLETQIRKIEEAASRAEVRTDLEPEWENFEFHSSFSNEERAILWKNLEEELGKAGPLDNPKRLQKALRKLEKMDTGTLQVNLVLFGTFTFLTPPFTYLLLLPNLALMAPFAPVALSIIVVLGFFVVESLSIHEFVRLLLGVINEQFYQTDNSSTPPFEKWASETVQRLVGQSFEDGTQPRAEVRAKLEYLVGDELMKYLKSINQEKDARAIVVEQKPDWLKALERVLKAIPDEEIVMASVHSQSVKFGSSQERYIFLAGAARTLRDRIVYTREKGPRKRIKPLEVWVEFWVHPESKEVELSKFSVASTAGQLLRETLEKELATNLKTLLGLYFGGMEIVNHADLIGQRKEYEALAKIIELYFEGKKHEIKEFVDLPLFKGIIPSLGKPAVTILPGFPLIFELKDVDQLPRFLLPDKRRVFIEPFQNAARAHVYRPGSGTVQEVQDMVGGDVHTLGRALQMRLVRGKLVVKVIPQAKDVQMGLPDFYQRLLDYLWVVRTNLPELAKKWEVSALPEDVLKHVLQKLAGEGVRIDKKYEKGFNRLEREIREHLEKEDIESRVTAGALRSFFQNAWNLLMLGYQPASTMQPDPSKSDKEPGAPNVKRPDGLMGGRIQPFHDARQLQEALNTRAGEAARKKLVPGMKVARDYVFLIVLEIQTKKYGLIRVVSPDWNLEQLRFRYAVSMGHKDVQTGFMMTPLLVHQRRLVELPEEEIDFHSLNNRVVYLALYPEGQFRYGEINAAFLDRTIEFITAPRAEVRGVEEKVRERINAKSGVFGAEGSRLRPFRQSGRSPQKQLHKTSKLPTFFKPSILQKISDENQRKRRHHTGGKNASTKGLSLQGKGNNQSGKNRGVGVQTEPHQIFPSFWRNLQSHWFSSSTSTQGRKSQAVKRKTASKTILKAFSRGVPYQRTSLTKNQLKRTQLTRIRAFKNLSPHSNLLTRDFKISNSSPSVQGTKELIRRFHISQYENYNKSKSLSFPQQGLSRAEVRKETLLKPRGEEGGSVRRIEEGAARWDRQKISARVFSGGRASKTYPERPPSQLEKLPSSQSSEFSSSSGLEDFGGHISQAAEKTNIRRIPDTTFIRPDSSEESQKAIEEDPANKAKALKMALAPDSRRWDSNIVESTLPQNAPFVKTKLHNRYSVLSIFSKWGSPPPEPSRAEVRAEEEKVAAAVASLHETVKGLKRGRMKGRFVSTAQGGNLFIFTNESGWDRLIRKLDGLPPQTKKIRVHLGVSGLSNYDVMASRKSGIGILVDVNRETVLLHQAIGYILTRPSMDQKEFVRKANVMLKQAYGFPPYPSQAEKLRELSWVKDPEKFRFIQQMFREGRILSFQMGLLDTPSTARLAGWLKQNNIYLDTFYVSNVPDWLTERQYKTVFRGNLSQLVGAGRGQGHVIDASYRLKGDHPVRIYPAGRYLKRSSSRSEARSSNKERQAAREFQELMEGIQGWDESRFGRYPPYVLTNEEEWPRLAAELEKLPFATGPPRIHIGLSGLNNYEIIAARKSDLAFLFDVNRKTVEIHQLIQRLITAPLTRRSFINRLLRELESPDRDLDFGEGHRRMLLQMSWLQNEEKFRHIQTLFQDGRILFRQFDFFDTRSTRKLSDFLRARGIKVDTVYVSNLREWISGERKEFLDDLAAWTDSTTYVIDSARPLGPVRRNLEVSIYPADEDAEILARHRRSSRAEVRTNTRQIRERIALLERTYADLDSDRRALERKRYSSAAMRALRKLENQMKKIDESLIRLKLRSFDEEDQYRVLKQLVQMPWRREAGRFASQVARLLRSSKNEIVQERAIRVLGVAGGRQYKPLVSRYLNSFRSPYDHYVRAAAIIALERLGAEEYLSQIVERLGDGDTKVRLYAVRTIQRLGGKEYIENLEHRLTIDGSVMVRLAISGALQDLRRASGQDAFRAEVRSPPEQVHPLQYLKKQEMRDFIVKYLKTNYVPWGLPDDLAERIIASLLAHVDDPDLARQKVYENVTKFDGDPDWDKAYSKYREVKYQDILSKLKPILDKLPTNFLILDLGAGANDLGLFIVEHYSQGKVIGTDPLGFHGSYLASQRAQHDNLSFYDQPSPTSLPEEVKDHSLDAVLMVSSAHHISDDELPLILAEAAKKLKPGGKLILIEDTYSSKIEVEANSNRELTNEFLALIRDQGPEFAEQFFSLIDWYGIILVHKADDMAMPYHFRSMEGWIERIEELGFELSSAQQAGFPEQTFHNSRSGVLEFTKRGEVRAEVRSGKSRANAGKRRGVFIQILDERQLNKLPPITQKKLVELIHEKSEFRKVRLSDLYKDILRDARFQRHPGLILVTEKIAAHQRRKIELAILNERVTKSQPAITPKQLARLMRQRPGYGTLKVSVVRDDIRRSRALKTHPNLKKEIRRRASRRAVEKRRALLLSILDERLQEGKPEITIPQLTRLARKYSGYAFLKIETVRNDISLDDRLREHPGVQVIEKNFPDSDFLQRRRGRLLSLVKELQSPTTLQHLAEILRSDEGFDHVTWQNVRDDLKLFKKSLDNFSEILGKVRPYRTSRIQNGNGKRFEALMQRSEKLAAEVNRFVKNHRYGEALDLYHRIYRLLEKAWDAAESDPGNKNEQNQRIRALENNLRDATAALSRFIAELIPGGEGDEDSGSAPRAEVRSGKLVSRIVIEDQIQLGLANGMHYLPSRTFSTFARNLHRYWGIQVSLKRQNGDFVSAENESLLLGIQKGEPVLVKIEGGYDSVRMTRLLHFLRRFLTEDVFMQRMELESPENLNPVFQFILGLSKRPVTKGHLFWLPFLENNLLHPDYIEFNRIIKAMLRPGKVLYGGAGTDLSNFLLSWPASEAYFTGRYRSLSLDDLKLVQAALQDAAQFREISKALDPAYRSFKSHYGFADEEMLNTKEEIMAALLLELSEMDISQIKVRLNGDYPQIGFEWADLDEEKIQGYWITFADIDITNPSQYPQQFKEWVESGIDGYYQHAGNRIALHYNSFVPYLYEHMNKSGVFATDDFYPLKFDPDLNKQIFAQALFPETLQGSLKMVDMSAIWGIKGEGLLWHKVMSADPREHYGWHVEIRVKETPPSSRAEVRLAERPSTPPRFGPIGRRAEVRSEVATWTRDLRFQAVRLMNRKNSLKTRQEYAVSLRKTAGRVRSFFLTAIDPRHERETMNDFELLTRALEDAYRGLVPIFEEGNVDIRKQGSIALVDLENAIEAAFSALAAAATRRDRDIKMHALSLLSHLNVSLTRSSRHLTSQLRLGRLGSMAWNVIDRLDEIGEVISDQEIKDRINKTISQLLQLAEPPRRAEVRELAAEEMLELAQAAGGVFRPAEPREKLIRLLRALRRTYREHEAALIPDYLKEVIGEFRARGIEMDSALKESGAEILIYDHRPTEPETAAVIFSLARRPHSRAQIIVLSEEKISNDYLNRIREIKDSRGHPIGERAGLFQARRPEKLKREFPMLLNQLTDWISSRVSDESREKGESLTLAARKRIVVTMEEGFAARLEKEAPDILDLLYYGIKRVHYRRAAQAFQYSALQSAALSLSEKDYDKLNRFEQRVLEERGQGLFISRYSGIEGEWQAAWIAAEAKILQAFARAA